MIDVLKLLKNKTTFILGCTINRMVYHVKEKTPESPLDNKEIKQVNFKGNQP